MQLAVPCHLFHNLFVTFSEKSSQTTLLPHPKMIPFPCFDICMAFMTIRKSLYIDFFSYLFSVPHSPISGLLDYKLYKIF